ncbi:MAG: glycosyltransferase family 4 protein [Acidobacteriales bacterium]|nr:glycosyltransferase family 4 protein [Terriglobales bacterium]
MPFHVAFDARHVRDFGIGTYIRNLLRALGNLDHENRYTITVHPGDVKEFDGLPANFKLATYARSDLDLRDLAAFPLFVRQFQPDLYHMPLNRVPYWMPKPYVVTVHDMSVLLFEQVSSWRQSLRHYLFRRGLLRADKVIAVSEATRRDVEHYLNIPASRIRRIYNAPDPRFAAHPNPADARAAGPGSADHERRRILERYQISYPYLLYTGTIRPQKNIPRMVEAFAVLRGDLENHPVYHDLRLIIIGDEVTRNPTVRQAVNKTHMEQAVRFLGFVPFDTLRVFYESAAAFVFPSLYEGFGLPPLEAMASGTPVVTSNVSSLPEVTGDAAMIVNPDNVFDIARGIREVLLDPSLRRDLVTRGYSQAASFSWDVTAREVLDTYREVAGKS